MSIRKINGVTILTLTQVDGGSPCVFYQRDIRGYLGKSFGTTILLDFGESVDVTESIEYVQKMLYTKRSSITEQVPQVKTSDIEKVAPQEEGPVQVELLMEGINPNTEENDQSGLTIRTKRGRLRKYARLISKEKAILNIKMAQMFFKGVDDSIIDYIADTYNVNNIMVKTAIVSILKRTDEVMEKECTKKGRFKKMLVHPNKETTLESLGHLEVWLENLKLDL